MRIAIVGSEAIHWTPETRTEACAKIKEILIDDTYYEFNRDDPGDVTYPIIPRIIGGIQMDTKTETIRLLMIVTSSSALTPQKGSGLVEGGPWSGRSSMGRRPTLSEFNKNSDK